MVTDSIFYMNRKQCCVYFYSDTADATMCGYIVKDNETGDLRMSKHPDSAADYVVYLVDSVRARIKYVDSAPTSNAASEQEWLGALRTCRQLSRGAAGNVYSCEGDAEHVIKLFEADAQCQKERRILDKII